MHTPSLLTGPCFRFFLSWFTFFHPLLFHNSCIVRPRIRFTGNDLLGNKSNTECGYCNDVESLLPSKNMQEYEYFVLASANDYYSCRISFLWLFTKITHKMLKCTACYLSPLLCQVAQRRNMYYVAVLLPFLLFHSSSWMLLHAPWSIPMRQDAMDDKTNNIRLSCRDFRPINRVDSRYHGGDSNY